MKLFLQIILILLIISTVAICIKQPEMHKMIMVYDSAYTLVPEKQAEVQKEEIPILEKTSKPLQTVVKVQNSVTPSVHQTKKENTTNIVRTQTSVPKVQKIQKTETKPVKKVIEDTKVQKIDKPSVKQEQVTVAQTTIPKKVQKPEPQKTLTEKEELVAWNIWRSNLQNKIMQDTKLPLLPNGIVFRFSFSVDRFGKVSNLQVWSDTPNYTPYAIQYIAPVIRSYQGHSILNFPLGTARISTVVKGGWKISSNEKFSTPQDYNDIEKVKKGTY